MKVTSWVDARDVVRWSQAVKTFPIPSGVCLVGDGDGDGRT